MVHIYGNEHVFCSKLSRQIMPEVKNKCVVKVWETATFLLKELKITSPLIVL